MSSSRSPAAGCAESKERKFRAGFGKKLPFVTFFETSGIGIRESPVKAHVSA
jgi:hypothetical protein